MKVLVIGSGGREHALCWKLSQSPHIRHLACLPGNPGIAQVAQCLSGEAVAVAQEMGADFVVVGPEEPLANGLVDRLNAVGIAAFGPTQDAAQLEASKAFCKQLLRQYDIPTATFEVFNDVEEARAYVRDKDDGAPTVVKADGLAAGKGVIVAQSRHEAESAVAELLRLKTAATPTGAKPQIVIEECLPGEEVSLIALTDGETVLPLVPAQDHKRVGEGDSGPNTGGMGCYSPVPVFTPELYEQTVATVLEPTLRALKAEGITYRGALYAGLMLTPSGIKVLEFNCRFGDPETQVILPRLQSDLLPLLLACAGRDVAGHPARLRDQPCVWTEQAAVCVVMAANGYPSADVRKGDAISGLDEAAKTGALVFQAGTARRDGQIVTNGGRVLGVTALGQGFLQARQNCYRAVERIHFDGAHYRRDIGWRCL